MKRLLRLLNIVNWPIWLKLSAAFLLAIGLPMILILYIVQGSYNANASQNLLNTLNGVGHREVDAINVQMNLAQTSLETFVNNAAYNRDMTRLLTPKGATPVAVGQMAFTLQTLLIGSKSFHRLSLLNTDGLVIVNVTSNNILATGDSAAQTPAFKQASAAALQNQYQSASVYNSGVPNMEFTQAVRNSAGGVVGFLSGIADVQYILENNLAVPQDSLPLYSYVLTVGQSPVLITQSAMLPSAQVSIASRSTGIEHAFQGILGSGIYKTGANSDIEVSGYYAPIPNPANPNSVLFALISEVPTKAIPTPSVAYLSAGQPFVIGVGIIVLLVVLVILFNQIITPPLSRLRRAILAVAGGNFTEPVPGANRGDEIGALSAAFVDMRTQVHTLLDDLQNRVVARTRDINATHDISRFAATQRNLQILMDQVVQLIIEQFPSIYHAQVFLLDSERVYAVLRASTGEPGKALLGRGHRLAVGSISIVGQSVEQSQTVIARDTTSSQVWRRNELLPDTRAELSIPLRVSNQVIGALDVQSKSVNAFTDDEINILQIMADQIALAIENARLYQESVRRLEEIERANRQATLQTWQEYVYGQRQRQLSSHAGLATGNDLSELRRRAIAQGKVVMGEATDHKTIPIAVPIVLRGQRLGAVEWELPVSDVSENKLQLAQDLANRLAVSLDNARLFQESQRATERERIVNAIAAKLTPQTEIGEILQTAVREVGQALRAPQVSIRLNRPVEQNNGHQNGNGANHSNGNS